MTSWIDTARRAEAEEDPPDVVDLVWRLRANERSAIAEVYDRHHETLRRFARRLLADEAAAEDLVQEVFSSLPKAIRSFEGRSPLRTFLVSVAANRCRHHVRAAIRYRKAKERYAASRSDAYPVRPDERHAQQEMAERLARALDALPVEQRVAFVLSVVEGRSQAEVALITGAPEPTVRTRVLRARQKLRALLDVDGDDD